MKKRAWTDAADKCDFSKTARGSDMNVRGSGEFCAAFLRMWQRDGYRDYLAKPVETIGGGVALLDRVVQNSAQLAGGLDDIQAAAGPPPPPSALPVRATRGKLRVSDLNALLAKRADVADLLAAQIAELGLAGDGSDE